MSALHSLQTLEDVHLEQFSPHFLHIFASAGIIQTIRPGELAVLLPRSFSHSHTRAHSQLGLVFCHVPFMTEPHFRILVSQKAHRGPGSSPPPRTRRCRYWSPRSNNARLDRKCTGHCGFPCKSHRWRSSACNAACHPRIPSDTWARKFCRETWESCDKLA